MPSRAFEGAVMWTIAFEHHQDRSPYARLCSDSRGCDGVLCKKLAARVKRCPLSRAKRTWLTDGVMSAYDPKRT